MPHMETCIGSERLYEGKIINLRRDTVRLENGETAAREVVEHPGGVGVLALDPEGRVLLVRQYRYAIGRVSLEIPAGKMNPGEDPAECGKRELEEETGYTPGTWRSLGTLDPSPGYTGEIIHLYQAGDLAATHQNLDPDEFLSVESVSFDQAVEMCLSGEITDSKTLAAVLKYRAMVEAE